VDNAVDRIGVLIGPPDTIRLRTALFEGSVREGSACCAKSDVAPPDTSLHRYGTELDLGPPAAYGWLAANAARFRFVKRYACKRWLSQCMESESGAHHRHGCRSSREAALR
jgi:hypothetical protein